MDLAEIGDFVGIHLCKLCAILRSRVYTNIGKRIPRGVFFSPPSMMRNGRVSFFFFKKLPWIKKSCATASSANRGYEYYKSEHTINTVVLVKRVGFRISSPAMRGKMNRRNRGRGKSARNHTSLQARKHTSLAGTKAHQSAGTRKRGLRSGRDVRSLKHRFRSQRKSDYATVLYAH